MQQGRRCRRLGNMLPSDRVRHGRRRRPDHPLLPHPFLFLRIPWHRLPAVRLSSLGLPLSDHGLPFPGRWLSFLHLLSLPVPCLSPCRFSPGVPSISRLNSHDSILVRGLMHVLWTHLLSLYLRRRAMRRGVSSHVVAMGRSMVPSRRTPSVAMQITFWMTRRTPPVAVHMTFGVPRRTPPVAVDISIGMPPSVVRTAPNARRPSRVPSVSRRLSVIGMTPVAGPRLPPTISHHMVLLFSGHGPSRWLRVV